MLKRVTLSFLLVVGIIWGSSFVFSTWFIFSKELRLSTITSPNIYLNSPTLSETILGYESSYDISNASVHSLCNTETDFLEKHQGVYYFSLRFIDDTCRSKNIVLKHNDQILAQTQRDLNLVQDSELFELMTDHPTERLQGLARSIQKNLAKYSLYETLHSKELGKYINYYKKQRKYQEFAYQRDMLASILIWRSKKYISPVPGKTLSREYSKIPNSGRGYRASYTDGIHHAWDIDWYLGEEVVALDDGVIVRIVDGFEFSDLGRILRGPLTEDDKLKNLDTLRGNQVWLKTTKGEVVFYSHLDEVDASIWEGDIVKRGTRLWTMGVTGVPEKWYDDYHLHFAVQVNPFDPDRAGSYNYGDYMKWDWKFKGESFEYILQNQGEIFE